MTRRPGPRPDAPRRAWDAATIAYLVSSMVLGVAGQVALKLAVAGAVASGGDGLGSILLHPTVWGALVLYASGTFFWLLVLSRVALSHAYAVTALNYVGVLAASVLFLDETLTPLRFAGAALIVVGVSLFPAPPASS